VFWVLCKKKKKETGKKVGIFHYSFTYKFPPPFWPLGNYPGDKGCSRGAACLRTWSSGGSGWTALVLPQRALRARGRPTAERALAGRERAEHAV